MDAEPSFLTFIFGVVCFLAVIYIIHLGVEYSKHKTQIKEQVREKEEEC